MAPQAVDTELGFVYVGMTRNAVGFQAGESQVLVAADAGNDLMLALNGKARLRMVERRIILHLP